MKDVNHFYDFFVLYVLVSKSRFLWRSSIFFQRETMTSTETRHVSLSNHKFNWCCIEQKYQIVSLRIQFLKNIWVEPAKKLVAKWIAIGWECLSWFLNQCDLLLSFYFLTAFVVSTNWVNINNSTLLVLSKHQQSCHFIFCPIQLNMNWISIRMRRGMWYIPD